MCTPIDFQSSIRHFSQTIVLFSEQSFLNFIDCTFFFIDLITFISSALHSMHYSEIRMLTIAPERPRHCTRTRARSQTNCFIVPVEHWKIPFEAHKMAGKSAPRIQIMYKMFIEQIANRSKVIPLLQNAGVKKKVCTCDRSQLFDSCQRDEIARKQFQNLRSYKIWWHCASEQQQ